MGRFKDAIAVFENLSGDEHEEWLDKPGQRSNRAKVSANLKVAKFRVQYEAITLLERGEGLYKSGETQEAIGIFERLRDGVEFKEWLDKEDGGNRAKVEGLLEDANSPAKHEEISAAPPPSPLETGIERSSQSSGQLPDAGERLALKRPPNKGATKHGWRSGLGRTQQPTREFVS